MPGEASTMEYKQKDQIPPHGHGTIALYQANDKPKTLDVQLRNETIWLAHAQMTDIFEYYQQLISRHVHSVFNEGELSQQSNMQKMHIALSDKLVVLYNLDVILSVGSRVKSQRGTQFRSWGTSVLKDYLVRGYAHNQHKLTEKRSEEVSSLHQRQQADRLLSFPAIPSVNRFNLRHSIRQQGLGRPGPADRHQRSIPQGSYDSVDRQPSGEQIRWRSD
jgi:hypothetical protein